jgi:hypothetical protein
MVNTMHQIGRSIGVALLSALTAQATGRYLTAHAHGTAANEIAKHAATHGYTAAFAISAGIFLAAAMLCGALIRKHPPRVAT